MSLAAVKVAMARESMDTELTPGDQLITAPPDVQAMDADVAAAESEDPMHELIEATNSLLADGTTTAEIVQMVEEAGDDVSEDALMVAQERLSVIAKRYSLEHCALSRESFAVADKRAIRDAVMNDAKVNMKYITTAACEGLREIAAHAAVGIQQMFKWRSSYVKDAQKVLAAARATQGSPVQGKTYTNKVRIAHFTDKNKNVLSEASQLAEAFKSSSEAAVACRVLQAEMEGVFAFVFKGNGRVNLHAIEAAFTKVGDDPYKGPIYSITGSAGLYGREIVASGFKFDVGQSSDQQQFLEAFLGVNYQMVEHWKISDLDNLSLEPMSPNEVASNASELISMANAIKNDFKVLDSLVDNFNQTGQQDLGDVLFNGAMQAASNPKLFLRFRGLVGRTINMMYNAGTVNIDLKCKAFNCLLDYYKFSLKASKSPAFESYIQNPRMVPATEGFGRFMLGLIGGTAAASATMGLGGIALSAVAKGRVEQLKGEIEAIGEDIAKMRYQGSKNALKEGKISEAMYKTQVAVTKDAIIEGACFGLLFQGFYLGIQYSKMGDLEKELNAKLKELNNMVTAELEAQRRSEDDKSKLAELNKLLETQDTRAAVATEGFGNFLIGFFVTGVVSGMTGGIAGIGISAAAKGRVEQLKGEIEAISEDITRIRYQGSKNALKEGKITEDVYKAQVAVTPGSLIEGACFGVLFNAIYAGIQYSKLVDLDKEMKSKLKELNDAVSKDLETQRRTESDNARIKELEALLKPIDTQGVVNA